MNQNQQENRSLCKEVNENDKQLSKSIHFIKKEESDKSILKPK